MLEEIFQCLLNICICYLFILLFKDNNALFHSSGLGIGIQPIRALVCIISSSSSTQLKIKAVATVDCGSIMCCDIGAIRHRHG